ncbi:mono/diheme cytochrome c family protein [Amaricoccus macauensis]|uniref:Mono/diheme cytochrome c family protein n=1 Tax=Amaricoccus macauensis TaxID=57001 RepID=A0A840SY21_9RHOB|nr:cytochrome c [Amaricoccus macauensis]MBB5223972.1 mono/diheme cytochrome c family protein [Amaricoccus macauensis]
MLVLRILGWLAVLGLVAGAGFWVLTMPRGLSAETLAAMPPGDAARGESIFWVGGCASCHAAAGAKENDRLKLGGGRVLATEFGNFAPPNISPDPEHGIGNWTAADFANSMLKGIGPGGEHLYPAFPYASYTRMELGDVADLWAYMQTLPPIPETAAAQTDLRFPFNIRRGVGLWKLAFLDDSPAVTIADASPEVLRGQYLSEGPGHCGECHTPRNFAGAVDTSRWLAGAPNPEGKGRIPNITPGGPVGDWSLADMVYFYQTGFDPDFDAVGGSMVDVQENLAMLPDDDLHAIAAYLAAVPPQASAPAAR